jgi:hypothetical protein
MSIKFFTHAPPIPRASLLPLLRTITMPHCPVLTPEWTLSSPFGPKALWTIMNTVWDGRIGLTISALPTTAIAPTPTTATAAPANATAPAHTSGLSQEILLCQFDSGIDAQAQEGSEKTANLENGLVSRRTEVMEGPDGRHVLNPGRYGKTVAWCCQNNNGNNNDNSRSSSTTLLPELFFADRRGTDPDDPAEAEGVFSKYAASDDGYTYRFNPPAWVANHGRLHDMDFDDGRGRLALAMEDDTTVLFEF